MTTEIRVPTLGESITEAVIAHWFKKEGDAVAADEPLVELETEKVTVEVPAPAAGVLSNVSAKDGDTVEVGALLGSIAEGEGKASAKDGDEDKSDKKEAKSEDDKDEKADKKEAKSEDDKDEKAEKKEAKAEDTNAEDTGETSGDKDKSKAAASDQPMSPAVKKLVTENDLDPSDIEGTGKDGRLVKGDVLAFLEDGGADKKARDEKPAETKAPSKPSAPDDEAREERVKMTRLRQTIARRLKEAQNTAAMLTTFNEVDMTDVMAMRNQYKELFEKKHGVRLGFMGIFIKAVIAALKDIPAVNAEIDGDELVYKNYYHVGVAVGTEKGLVVPVVRDADALSLAGIEQTITDFGRRARDGKLGLEDMQGGTFTISNGGVYGSLMSTPILNAPQSGILGMHKIQERPMVVDGEVKVRPMMYLALSYDHRIVDGREAVTFLVRVKECIEDPQRLVLDL